MKHKHVPERTCVGCRTVKAKRELVRIVRDPSGAVDLDTTGKKSGRGVYVCPSPSCLEAALKAGRLKTGLETDIPAEVVAKIRERLLSV
ncbi:MAG: YlxR family protein [Selenomonadales bacterium]|nr:YlxR family protein [Selenomonadales bacterium]